MITITVNQHKKIIENKTMDIFEGESNIDFIRINISKIIKNVNVTNFLFFFDYIDANNVNGSIQLSEYAVIGDMDDYLSFEIPVTDRFTYASGKIKYWIRILQTDSELLALTPEITLTIKEHKEVI